VRATRGAEGVVLGGSPRAAVHLLTAAKAHASLHGRTVVELHDVVEMAPSVLTHRLIVDGPTPAEVVGASVEAALGATA
jgi:MoxR-like ATPase